MGSLNTSGVGFIKSMSTLERHAELVYAESLFEKVSSCPYVLLISPFLLHFVDEPHCKCSCFEALLVELSQTPERDAMIYCAQCTSFVEPCRIEREVWRIILNN